MKTTDTSPASSSTEKSSQLLGSPASIPTYDANFTQPAFAQYVVFTITPDDYFYPISVGKHLRLPKPRAKSVLYRYRWKKYTLAPKRNFHSIRIVHSAVKKGLSWSILLGSLE